MKLNKKKLEDILSSTTRSIGELGSIILLAGIYDMGFGFGELNNYGPNAAMAAGTVGAFQYERHNIDSPLGWSVICGLSILAGDYLITGNDYRDYVEIAETLMNGTLRFAVGGMLGYIAALEGGNK